MINLLNNKDDNIHKSKALKWKDAQTNIKLVVISKFEKVCLYHCTILFKESVFQKSDKQDNYITWKIVVKKVKMFENNVTFIEINM